MPEVTDVEAAPRIAHGWPVWPQATEATRTNLEAVLTSGRWTISGPYRGAPSFERRFSQAYAAYCGVSHCIPTASGTTALAVALEAVGVGAGDEVIVPGLSWVASASAVLGINAVPVLVDVDPDTFCIDSRAVEAALTERTRAITVVHLYSALADLDAVADIARRADLPLIEDCSQAHGARYGDRAVGTWGTAGVFSMQGSKLLTSGEGGAIVTDDAELADRAEHLRSDGRTLSAKPVEVGAMELLETAALMGANAVLSEFHAAILLAQLEDLDEQNRRRQASGAQLDERLLALGCAPQTTVSQTTSRSFYRYAVRLPEEAVATVGVPRLAEDLTARLGFSVVPTHRALSENPLHNPPTRRRFGLNAAHLEAVNPGRFSLPMAKQIHRRTVTFGHEILLAPLPQIEEIADVFEEVLRDARRREG